MNIQPGVIGMYMVDIPRPGHIECCIGHNYYMCPWHCNLVYFPFRVIA